MNLGRTSRHKHKLRRLQAWSARKDAEADLVIGPLVLSDPRRLRHIEHKILHREVWHCIVWSLQWYLQFEQLLILGHFSSPQASWSPMCCMNGSFSLMHRKMEFGHYHLELNSSSSNQSEVEIPKYN